MKEYDNTSIERLAKSEVEAFFAYTGYVRPYISENDKTPTWDGNLFVYSQKREMSNETLRFKVPLQLKGEEFTKVDFPDKTYYQISAKELELYNDDGGVLFIKVLIFGRNKRIYYNFLTKRKLGTYMKSMSGKSRSVRLNPLSENISEFLDEASAFHLQQKNTPISPLDLKDKVIQIRCDAPKFEGENDYAFIIRNQRQLLVKVEGVEGEFYLDCGNISIKSPIKEDCKVSIKDTVFYSSLTRVYEPDRIQTLYIGKSLSIIIKPSEKGVDINLSMTLKADTFDELIHELRFLVALGSCKALTIDGITMNLPQINNESDIFKHWEHSLKLWEDANTLFQMLHVYEKLDINAMEEEDYSNLHKLVQALLYNEPITTKIKHDYLESTKIGNLNILLFVRVIGKKNCKLESVQNSLITLSKEEDGKYYPLPIFSKILREKPLQSNINFDGMIDEYNKFLPDNPGILKIANEDVLLYISHFDTKKNTILLEKAKELCNWLMKINDSPIYFLNLLQIKHRESESFTSEEKEKLYRISEEDPSNTTRWAASILLGEYDRADYRWSKMSSNEKGIYVQYPIFQLVPNEYREIYINEVKTITKQLK